MFKLEAKIHKSLRINFQNKLRHSDVNATSSLVPNIILSNVLAANNVPHTLHLIFF